MGNAERTEPVTMIGPKGLEKVVSALRIIAPELPFPIRFIELSGPKEEIFVNGYQLEAFRVNHNVVCYGYNILVPRAGRFMMEKAVQNQVPKAAWSRLQKGEEVLLEGKVYTQDMVLGEKRRGIKVTYCTDTRPTQSILEHANQADLFICEGMYGEREKEAKAKEYKHMTFYEAAELGKKADVKEMWLTHYSPSLVRPEQYKKELSKAFSKASLGWDRRSVTLEFDKDE
jgi:ribonuclease Z